MTLDHRRNASSTAAAPNDANLGILLSGLDGANPLGFLAAIGVLHILTRSCGTDSVRMKWAASGGTWVPEIHTDFSKTPNQDAILTALFDGLAKNIADHPVRILDTLKTAGDVNSDRRNVILEQRDQSTAHNRMWTDWLAAVASEMAGADAINQLQTARRDYYYKNLASVIEKTTPDHLRRSLFHSWDYADPLDSQSLHLDPSEDRRHAHQWNQPSGDPDRKRSGGMLGANRLAIEAIPLFTSLPEGGTLRTIGFSGNRSTDTRWTWPIWDVAVSLPVIRSLLLLPELQQETPKPAEVTDLRARGVAAVYRTHRILVGKTPNFTPARRIA